MVLSKSIKQSIDKQPNKKHGKSNQELDEIEEWKKSRQLLKPKNQIELNDAELKEIIDNQLTTKNPQLPDGGVAFNYSLGYFQPIPQVTNMVVIYESVGSSLHKDTAEAQQQMIELGIDPADLEVTPEPSVEVLEVIQETVDEQSTEENQIEKEKEEDEIKEEVEEDEPEQPDKVVEDEEPEAEGDGEEGQLKTDKMPIAKGGRPKKLTNQFNFCDRAALTYNNPTRSQETQTVPPCMATFSANVLQWVIYDAYQNDFEIQQLEKQMEKEKKERGMAPVSKIQPNRKIPDETHLLNETIQKRMMESSRVLERMINQNIYDDIAKDYRYWDDPSDEYRENEGTLLPLWKFVYNKTKKLTITDIVWSPFYYDLFAVCFGSLEFIKPADFGAVCVFTLKNPAFPDYICISECGAMCVDIHPKYPYMIVVGLYDGNVQVFNIQATCKQPAFESNHVSNKHKGVIWEVKWARDLPDGELNFFSAAADGLIKNWVLMQNELSVTTVITLFANGSTVSGPDGVPLQPKNCASCIKIHPKNPLIYLVGTEEGNIYKCSTEYNSMWLMTYQAHQLPVYRIDFNKFNSNIFVSCSGDWKVNIWEDSREHPLFVFDIADRIGDVKWAPFSSTVFAIVTSEGKVHVFDLNVNKYMPICIQAIVSKRKNKLTRLSFNLKLPIIIVGDDKGCTTTLKLSPNLRIPCKAPKKQQHLDQWTLQCMKLDQLLSMVREDVVLTLAKDELDSEDS